MKTLIEVSTDKDKLQLDVICDFLSTAYWAKERSRDDIERSIQHSDCFGIYRDGRQVGFVRVLSDRVAFAYLMDVFVIPEERGKGYAKILLQTVLDHPDYQGVKRWVLITRDAHGLYQQFDFKPLATPDRFMEWMKPR